MIESKPDMAASNAPDSSGGRSDEPLSSKDILEHGWRYFALHAEQRISMFNHFLVVFGLIAAGLAGCLQAEGVLRLVGVGLGLTLVIVARVFRQIDERNTSFVKRAEAALGKAESAVPAHSRLFRDEPAETTDAKIFKRAPTHGESLRAMFRIAQCVGVAGAILALCLAFISEPCPKQSCLCSACGPTSRSAPK